MARRSYRRRSRKLLTISAPRKGTLVIASAFYIVGLFGALELIPIAGSYAVTALAIAGGLLILGVLLRDL